jgi:hypothetical protein
MLIIVQRKKTISSPCLEAQHAELMNLSPQTLRAPTRPRANMIARCLESRLVLSVLHKGNYRDDIQQRLGYRLHASIQYDKQNL